MRDIREYLNLIEQLQRTVKLSDLYDERELNDEQEVLSSYISDADLETDFPVHAMSAIEAKTLRTVQGDMTVWQAFMDFAEPEQEELVQHKMDHFDEDRIIIIQGNKVVDGNHHVVAAIKLNKPVNYITLAGE